MKQDMVVAGCVDGTDGSGGLELQRLPLHYLRKFIKNGQGSASIFWDGRECREIWARTVQYRIRYKYRAVHIYVVNRMGYSTASTYCKKKWRLQYGDGGTEFSVGMILLMWQMLYSGDMITLFVYVR